MVIDDILQARVKPRGVAAPLETTNLCLLLPEASNDLTESMAVGVAIAWRPSTWSGAQERAIFFQFVWSPQSLKPVLGKDQQRKQWNFQISCMDAISTLLDAISCCTIFYRTSQLTSLMILRMTIAFLTLIHHDTFTQVPKEWGNQSIPLKACSHGGLLGASDAEAFWISHVAARAVFGILLQKLIYIYNYIYKIIYI